jgi:hypothetical protein
LVDPIPARCVGPAAPVTDALALVSQTNVRSKTPDNGAVQHFST